MLRIWGRLSSLNVRKAVWAAREAGVAFERIDAGGPFRVVDTPEYRAMNPNGMVPLIDDDGYTLWESNVIVRYLSARHGAALYPDDLRARFEAERWMDWQQTTLNPAGRGAFLQWFRVPTPDPAVIARSIAETEPLFALLDAHLPRQRFIAGDSFTMADIPIGCEVHRWWSLPKEHVPHPHVDRWYRELLAREATQGVLGLPLT